MRRPRIVAFALALTFVFAAGIYADGRAMAQQSFYEGKRIRMIVPRSTGGGYDLYARVIARHMGRHIPGNPSFIVQNIPGGAGIVATNYMYRVASRDGLTMGLMSREAPTQEVSGLAGVEFKMADFSWIGNANVEMTVAVGRADRGFKTLKELIKSPKPLVVGTTGPGSATYNFPAVLKEVLGANFEIISGYKGTADIRGAVERGELDGIGGWSWSSVVTTGAEWLERRFVNILVYHNPERNKEMAERGVPWLFDFPISKPDRDYVDAVFFPNVVGRPFAAPPGVAPERLAILRTAFMKTMEDPKFKSEAAKLDLEIVDPLPGDKVAELVKRFFATDPKILARVAQLLGGK